MATQFWSAMPPEARRSNTYRFYLTERYGPDVVAAIDAHSQHVMAIRTSELGWHEIHCNTCQATAWLPTGPATPNVRLTIEWGVQWHGRTVQPRPSERDARTIAASSHHATVKRRYISAWENP